MKAQLTQYVSLLFAGVPNSEDIRQEILQNTLDRYDDLIEKGKTPEAAYRLAISGIGDINEILGEHPAPLSPAGSPVAARVKDSPLKALLRAIAIGLYILCPLPVIVLGEMGMDTWGVCGTLCFVAIATVLIILGKKTHTNPSGGESTQEKALTPAQELRKSINSLIWAIGLAVYFIVSFATMAWYITWVIFPLLGAVEGLVKACIDLREASKHEN